MTSSDRRPAGKLQPVRGTRDILGEDARRMARVVATFRRLAGLWSFEEIATPVFEFTEVFARTLGESSDVVTKEMYSFTDRSGESLTLRPEYTAGIARAWLSNGLAQQGVARLFGHGPMFRHERPQKGRYRQFHQLDAEIVGDAGPVSDVDLLSLAWQLLVELGIADKVTLHLNTLGDAASREAWRAALVDYFSGHAARLSEDSRERLHKNPLRILDSKDEGDRALLPDAPRIGGFLNDASRAFFERVREDVERLGIPHVHDEHLVRGLDYYTHTAFEFVTSALGAQGTVLGGGRYDGLIGQMGGPSTPGVGWAAGIERLAMLLAEAPAAPRPTVLIPLGAAAEQRAPLLARELRTAGTRLEIDGRGNLRKRLERAARKHARHAVLLGEDELARGMASLRDLDSGEQTEVALDDLAGLLARL